MIIRLSIALFNGVQILTLVICFCSFALFGQDGSLDSIFGINGISTKFKGTDISVRQVAVQKDGKIVVFAGCNYCNPEFILYRYNVNGLPDSTFGVNGMVNWSNNAAQKYYSGNASSLVLLDNGKILVAGYYLYQVDPTLPNAQYEFALGRFNSNGTRDSTFGINGRVHSQIGERHEAYGKTLAIQADEKIIVGGYMYKTGGYTNCLVRYHSDGKIDSSFGLYGIAEMPIGGYISSIAIQKDGRILFMGNDSKNNSTFISLARFNNNGTIDKTFDNDGLVTTSLGVMGDISGNMLTLQSDGKIFITGYAILETDKKSSHIALVRYNVNGSLDNTFDKDGIVLTQIDSNRSSASSIVIQSDRKIVISGNTTISTTSYPCLIRYNSDGSLDSTFDFDGKVVVPVEFRAGSSSVVLQSDNKIVIASTEINNRDIMLFLARYNNRDHSTINSSDIQLIELSIYPNPMNNQSTIQTSINLQNASLLIFNIYGQLVSKRDNLYGNEVDFFRDNLSNGMYFINLLMGSRIISNVLKIVISE